jgi:hypothetical protein
LSTTNPTWTDLGANPDPLGEKLTATNRLSYGTAVNANDVTLLGENRNTMKNNQEILSRSRDVACGHIDRQTDIAELIGALLQLLVVEHD